jgi:hypothetical protein
MGLKIFILLIVNLKLLEWLTKLIIGSCLDCLQNISRKSEMSSDRNIKNNSLYIRCTD